MSRGRVWGLVALLLAASACQGPGVPSSELPAESIAIAYRAPELARERAEFLDAQDPEKRSERRQSRWGQLGVVPIDEVQGELEELFGSRDRPGEMKFAARLALLDPRTREVEVIRAARRGSRPQAWSPDRGRLLLSQLEGDYLQLYEYDVERREVRQVTRGPDVHARGCYGPKGRFVVMSAGFEQGKIVTRLMLTDPTGSRAVAVSAGPRDHSPACSPDGRLVAWVATQGRDRDRVFVASLPDGEPRPLGPGRHPAFSPDGQWVILSTRLDGRWQLWRIRPDGTGRTRIGRGVLDETQPAVSPDGRQVAYVVEEQNRQYLYLRRIDGSGDRILFRDGDAESPIW